MSDESDLTQKGLENIANEILSGSVEESTDSNPDVALDVAKDVLGDVLEETPDPSTEAEEEHPVSDHNEETEESDDDTPVEAEADEEESEEPTDDVSEYFEVDYDDAKDGIYPIKINGEIKMMKFGEIQNQLARAESASKKSQEANHLQQELETREARLQEQEQWFEARSKATVQSEQLAQLANQYNAGQQALNKARAENDSYRMVQIKDKLEQIQGEYSHLEHQVRATNEEANKRKTQEQFEILKSKGYGEVVTDEYRGYLADNLSDTAIQAISYDATLAIALEKARKWDASQGKSKRSLKKSKSLSAGGGKISQSKSNAQQAKLAAMKAGKGSQEDALAGLDAIANEVLFG